METIQKIAKLENWKKDDKNVFDSHKGYWGPFLTPEESEELCAEKFEDDPKAVQEKEQRYRNKYSIQQSSSSSLTWAEDTYE